MGIFNPIIASSFPSPFTLYPFPPPLFFFFFDQHEIIIYWAFRVGAIALLALQSFFAFRLVHLAQHRKTSHPLSHLSFIFLKYNLNITNTHLLLVKAHVQARIMMWLLIALSSFFLICDLLATLVTGGLQVGLEWVPFFLQEVAELILWVSVSCILYFII